MSEDVIFFSGNLILVRKYVGVTQSGLAEKLGVKPNTISNYEKEVTTPDFKVLKKLSTLFCLPSDTLLYRQLSQDDLDAKPEWLQSVRRNFDLNDIEQPVPSIRSVTAQNGDQLTTKQLIELLEKKDMIIMTLNRQIGRLEYEIELLKKEG